MTGRERIDAALSSTGTDEIPAAICYEGIYVRDHWDQLTECPWWFAHSPEVAHQLAWRRDVIRRTGHDWTTMPGLFYTRDERERLTIEEAEGNIVLADESTGVRRRLYPPLRGGDSRLDPDAPSVARTRNAIESAMPLPPPIDVAAADADGSTDLLQAFRAEHRAPGSTGPSFMTSVSSPLWRLFTIWQFDDVMATIATDPDLVENACTRSTELALQTVRNAAALGVDVVWVEECMTDMVSPAAFERLNVPSVVAVNDEIRAHGMKSVYYYCGNPGDKWKMLFGSHADALALEESKKGFTIDVEEAAARAEGRCAILGNLDAIDLLAHGSDGDLRDEIERQIDVGRTHGDRFVMSIGSPVTPGTTVDRVRRYTDLVREIGSR